MTTILSIFFNTLEIWIFLIPFLIAFCFDKKMNIRNLKDLWVIIIIIILDWSLFLYTLFNRNSFLLSLEHFPYYLQDYWKLYVALIWIIWIKLLFIRYFKKRDKYVIFSFLWSALLCIILLWQTKIDMDLSNMESQKDCISYMILPSWEKVWINGCLH